MLKPYELKHDKTNKMMCTQKTQINLGIHPVRTVFTVFFGWLRTQCFFMQTAKNLIRLGECLGWSESSLGAWVILLVLACFGPYCSYVGFINAISFGVSEFFWLIRYQMNQKKLWYKEEFFLSFGFYGQSRLFQSFWAESIVMWGEQGKSPRKTTWPPASRTWLVSHVTWARLKPTEMRWWAF